MRSTLTGTVRAAAYLRQSVDVTEGIERQDNRTAALIKLRGWKHAGRYSDNDTSATKTRGASTAWARLLNDFREDRLDVVVAVDLDRLLRTPRDLITLIDLGIRVVTVDGEIDLTSADGEFRATMMAAVARFEVRRKSERQRRANEHRARRGLAYGGRRAFGYESDGMTLREPEAEALRWGYEQFLAGMPLAGIAREWNGRGYTTGQSRQERSGHAGEPSPWKWDSVRSVLLNPRNAGIVRYNGEVLDVPAQWPAVVPESTFRAAVAVLENPARRRAPRGDRYLLSGLARCGVCGSPVHAGASARGKRGYRCKGSTGHFSRLAEPIELYVEELVVARLSREDAVRLTQRHTPDTDALHLEAVGLRERLDALAIDYADGKITRSMMATAAERMRNRLEVLEGKLADAGRVDVLGPLVGAEDVRAAWGALSLGQKRAVIEALMEPVIHSVGRGRRNFDPASVEPGWKGAR